MRGRSPHNKPSLRIKEAYSLLLELGGEARWKDLKANLKELGWGPTTLKQTLDQMIEKKLIKREARLGTKGAEVWYRTTTDLDFLKWNIVLKPTLEVQKEDDKAVQLITSIREEARKLDGKEKENFLRDSLHRVIYVAMRYPIVQFLVTLREAEISKFTELETLLNFDLMYDYSVKQPYKVLLQLFYEYREYAMEIIHQILREPYKPPSVQRRSLRGLIESRASASEWVKSLEDNHTKKEVRK